MSKYFAPYNNSSENIKVELDLSNYATKKDIKDITHIDASGFASKTNLAALKTEVDKIDTDKLKTVPDDLAKLSNVVKNNVVKRLIIMRFRVKSIVFAFQSMLEGLNTKLMEKLFMIKLMQSKKRFLFELILLRLLVLQPKF